MMNAGNNHYFFTRHVSPNGDWPEAFLLLPGNRERHFSSRKVLNKALEEHGLSPEEMEDLTAQHVTSVELEPKTQISTVGETNHHTPLKYIFKFQSRSGEHVVKSKAELECVLSATLLQEWREGGGPGRAARKSSATSPPSTPPPTPPSPATPAAEPAAEPAVVPNVPMPPANAAFRGPAGAAAGKQQQLSGVKRGRPPRLSEPNMSSRLVTAAATAGGAGTSTAAAARPAKAAAGPTAASAGAPSAGSQLDVLISMAQKNEALLQNKDFVSMMSSIAEANREKEAKEHTVACNQGKQTDLLQQMLHVVQGLNGVQAPLGLPMTGPHNGPQAGRALGAAVVEESQAE